jgi:protein KRI1
MPRKKSSQATNGVKHSLEEEDSAPFNVPDERPAKKAKLLDDSDGDEDEEDIGGVSLKVNEEYARRFEHNKKRAEKHRRETAIEH